jgi:hypothetical protein
MRPLRVLMVVVLTLLLQITNIWAISGTKVCSCSGEPIGPLTGYTRHGLSQAMGRNGGVGVSPRAILDAVRNPLSVAYQPGSSTYLYEGRYAKVSLSEAGRLVTTWATHREGWRMMR